MKIVEGSIRQPVTVLVGVVLVLVAALVAVRQVPVQLTPDVDDTIVSVSTVWPGASPEEMRRRRNEALGAEADGAEVAMWRRAAEERLTKLEEANELLGRQQVELDQLRNALAGEQARVDWLRRESAMYEEAARERLRVIERLTEPES